MKRVERMTTPTPPSLKQQRAWATRRQRESAKQQAQRAATLAALELIPKRETETEEQKDGEHADCS